MNLTDEPASNGLAQVCTHTVSVHFSGSDLSLLRAFEIQRFCVTGAGGVLGTPHTFLQEASALTSRPASPLGAKRPGFQLDKPGPKPPVTGESAVDPTNVFARGKSPKSYTLHPTPYTLNPKPYTPIPKP